MVVVVVDAGAIERGLYLALQVVETGVPVVVALNMVDEAAAAGMAIDAARLGGWLGVQVVPTVAPAGKGLDALRAAIGDTIGLAPRRDVARSGLPATVESAVADVERVLTAPGLSRTPAARRSWAVWSLLSHESDEDDVEGLDRPVQEAVDAARRRAGGAGVDLYEALITARYRWIEAVVADVRQGDATARHTWTDRIDGVLTHRVYGMAAFAAVMALPVRGAVLLVRAVHRHHRVRGRRVAVRGGGSIAVRGAGGPAGGRRHCRRRQRRGVRAADRDAVVLHRGAGGCRLSRPCRRS